VESRRVAQVKTLTENNATVDGQGQPAETADAANERRKMTGRQFLRLVREGELVAEVAVELVESEGGWTPYLSLEDAYKLDNVREALRAGDVRRAAKLAAHIYRLTPVQT
jgi:hypothetical protein